MITSTTPSEAPEHLFTVCVSQSDFLSNFSIFTLDSAEWCIGPNLVPSQSWGEVTICTVYCQRIHPLIQSRCVNKTKLLFRYVSLFTLISLFLQRLKKINANFKEIPFLINMLVNVGINYYYIITISDH